MLTIILGYTGTSRKSTATVLYCGHDSSAASAAASSPPPGIRRTSVVRNPAEVRQRFFSPTEPAPTTDLEPTPEPTPDPEPALNLDTPPKPSRSKSP